jgi:hypothetical protein
VLSLAGAATSQQKRNKMHVARSEHDEHTDPGRAVDDATVFLHK